MCGGLNPEEAMKVNNVDDAVRHIREKLGMQAGATRKMGVG